MKRFTGCCLVAALVCISLGADWRQFRGPGGRSVAEGAKLPVVWSESENIAWKAELPGRGPSGPIVIGDKIVVTSSGGVKQDHLYVTCFGAADGKELWRRRFWATGRTYTHPTSSVAAPTPASDGERIFAFYASNDLACLDLDGNLLWYRGLAHDYPKAGNDIGMAASPVVVDGVVIVQIENQGDSFASGIDAQTGEELWRVDRDPRANWTSPAILPAAGKRKNLVLLQSGSGLTAYDPQTGREAWNFASDCSTIPSPVAVGNRIYLPSNGLTVLEASEQSASVEFVWESNQLKPGSATPIIHDGRIYTLGSSGVINCGSAVDGKPIWKLRVKGPFWATPIIADNRLYCVNQKGAVQVVELGDDKGKLLATNELGETIQGSPAVANNALYFRSDGHLWKVAESK